MLPPVEAEPRPHTISPGKVSDKLTLELMLLLLEKGLPAFFPPPLFLSFVLLCLRPVCLQPTVSEVSHMQDIQGEVFQGVKRVETSFYHMS